MAGKLISRRVLYKGRAFTVRVDEVEQPSGRKTTREIVEHSNAIAVIALDKQGRIILERQFRQAAGKELLEIPAGGIEPGEDPADAVCREMQEETGFLPESVKLLGSFFLAPGYSTEYMYLYLATDLKPSRLTAEDTDEIRLEYVSPEDVPQLIKSGAIDDGKSIAGLLLYLCKK